MIFFGVFFLLFPIFGITSGDWDSHEHGTYWFFLICWSLSWLCFAVLRSVTAEEKKDKEQK